MYPPPAAEVHEPCARPLHQPAAPLQHPTVQHLEGCSIERGKGPLHAAHRSAATLLMEAKANVRCSWIVARAPRERPRCKARAPTDRCPSGQGSWYEWPWIVVRAAMHRGPSGQGSWHERPWIVARASMDRALTSHGVCKSVPWPLHKCPVSGLGACWECPRAMPSDLDFGFSGRNVVFDQISRPKTNQI